MKQTHRLDIAYSFINTFKQYSNESFCISWGVYAGKRNIIYNNGLRPCEVLAVCEAVELIVKDTSLNFELK